jgi:ABC-type multidrug transport system fused ATPase/permease subunit
VPSSAIDVATTNNSISVVTVDNTPAAGRFGRPETGTFCVDDVFAVVQTIDPRPYLNPGGKLVVSGHDSGDDSDDEFAALRAENANAIWRLFRDYGRDEAPRFVAGGVASVLQMTMELVPAFVLAVAIDALFFDTRPFALPLVPDAWLPTAVGDQFLLAGGLLAGAYALNSLLGWANDYLWNGFSQHFQHAVRVDAYDAMQRRETEFFDDRQTGEVMSVLNNDVNELEGFLTNNLNSLITIVVRCGGMAAVMLLINWRLALIPVAAIPALGYVSYWFVETVHPKYQSVREAVGRLNSRLENNIGGIETVKAFATEPFETGRVRDASGEYLDTQWDAITTRILFFPTLQAATAAAYVAVFFVGGWWVITGAGKSTLMKLLLRFYDVDDGCVRVDGRDVRDVTLRSLREAIGYVSQEPYLFYGTVAENVAYGLDDATRDEIREAARLAGAHEFVTQLTDGYDTMVGERGVKLSGGQRQRIAIARAILRDPEILVLDEATSHVDNETEAIIQRSLADIAADRTTFAIAHRLSTVRDADQILVLEDGAIVERGTHDALLAADGLYADLWTVQLGEADTVADASAAD